MRTRITCFSHPRADLIVKRCSHGTIKGFWIDGMAQMVHPFSRENFPEARIYMQGRSSSIVEVGRFTSPIDDKDLAAYFGLELARMVVDHCLTA